MKYEELKQLVKDKKFRYCIEYCLGYLSLLNFNYYSNNVKTDKNFIIFLPNDKVKDYHHLDNLNDIKDIHNLSFFVHNEFVICKEIEYFSTINVGTLFKVDDIKVHTDHIKALLTHDKIGLNLNPEQINDIISFNIGISNCLNKKIITQVTIDEHHKYQKSDGLITIG